MHYGGGEHWELICKVLVCLTGVFSLLVAIG